MLTGCLSLQSQEGWSHQSPCQHPAIARQWLLRRHSDAQRCRAARQRLVSVTVGVCRLLTSPPPSAGHTAVIQQRANFISNQNPGKLIYKQSWNLIRILVVEVRIWKKNEFNIPRHNNNTICWYNYIDFHHQY